MTVDLTYETTMYRSDELDQPANDRARRPERRGGTRAVEPVPAKALERDHSAAMVGEEAIRSRERLGAGDLGEHLALTRAADLELVQERVDRGLVPGEELEPLEWVVPLLGDAFRFGWLLRHRRITARTTPGFRPPKVLRLAR